MRVDGNDTAREVGEKDASGRMGRGAEGMSTAEQLKAQGNELYSQGKWLEAIEYYTKAIALDASVSSYFSNRSLCHSHLGRWGPCLYDAKEAIARDRKNIKGHYLIGQCIVEMWKQSGSDKWNLPCRDALDSLLTAKELTRSHKQFHHWTEKILRLFYAVLLIQYEIEKRETKKQQRLVLGAIEEGLQLWATSANGNSATPSLDRHSSLSSLYPEEISNILADGQALLKKIRADPAYGGVSVSSHTSANEGNSNSSNGDSSHSAPTNVGVDGDDDVEIPSQYCCPITHDWMMDPWVTPTGTSYERSALEAWLKKTGRDPLTNESCSLKECYANLSLRDAIEETLKKSPYLYVI